MTNRKPATSSVRANTASSATVDEDGHPYATPLSYVLDGDSLLIHTGIAGGQKTDNWTRDPRVCVTVAMDMEPVYVKENGEPGFLTTRYASVIATGTVRRVVEPACARRALAQLCLKYCPSIETRSEMPSNGSCPRPPSGLSTSSISPARRDGASRTAKARLAGH